MNRNARRALYWAPRILCILFAIFLSLFSLDVFEEGIAPGRAIVAWLLHMIPVLAVAAVLALAWRWEWVGAVLCVALAAAHAVATWGRFPWWVYLLVPGPLILVGALFLLNWVFREELRER